MNSKDGESSQYLCEEISVLSWITVRIPLVGFSWFLLAFLVWDSDPGRDLFWSSKLVECERSFVSEAHIDENFTSRQKSFVCCKWWFLLDPPGWWDEEAQSWKGTMFSVWALSTETIVLWEEGWIRDAPSWIKRRKLAL